MTSLSQIQCLEDFKRLAKRKLPGFAFDYIEEGCNDDCAIRRNRRVLDEVLLEPHYLTSYREPDTQVNLFGKAYASPFGIAPLGLSGLIWPNASIMHARGAKQANIPFVLSTVATISIEQAAKEAGDNFWFQLYPPADRGICIDLMQRAWQSGCRNLVVTLDVPTPSRRIKAIKSGLSVPPKVSVSNVLQAACRPHWSMATLKQGMPEFANLTPYMGDAANNMQDAANFIRTTMRDVVDLHYLQWIREHWQGNLIVKGVLGVADAKDLALLQVDGLVVSNHGGRQLDAAASPLEVLTDIKQLVAEDLLLMADSGIASGVDVARYLAMGAEAVLLGRGFMYAVAAKQQIGVHHYIELLQIELQQVLSQLHCNDVQSLIKHLG